MSDFTDFDIDLESDIESSIVDLTMFSIDTSIQDTKIISASYTKNYEDRTIYYYKTMRLRKMDPIIGMDLETDDYFKFPYMWDPYTGERLGLDPFGPLCFDPDTLIYYYYINRLKNLWTEPTNDDGGYYEGYYDMLVGAGENINIVARGECPEKYLFRLPIIDCYLENDYNKSFITMGPKLTDEEIKEIDRLAQKRPNNYRNLYRKNRPSLELIKKYYDEAIDNNPRIKYTEGASEETKKELRYKINCMAVDSLKKL